MGSSLPPVLAELFMEHFEEIAFDGEANAVKPALFKRYVDDCFAIVETGKEESLLEHLNSIFPEKIKMTMEKEESNRLPFLDVLVLREGRKLSTKFDSAIGEFLAAHQLSKSRSSLFHIAIRKLVNTISDTLVQTNYLTAHRFGIYNYLKRCYSYSTRS
uniref:Reverse transcriptase domain-containing protein n=1 Tax=Trichuris muris TaxID=70415 RepID=A0A5S6QFG2_TRIMR